MKSDATPLAQSIGVPGEKITRFSILEKKASGKKGRRGGYGLLIAWLQSCERLLEGNLSEVPTKILAKAADSKQRNGLHGNNKSTLSMNSGTKRCTKVKKNENRGKTMGNNLKTRQWERARGRNFHVSDCRAFLHIGLEMHPR